MEMDLFWIGLGLAAFGYFIGNGLKYFKNPNAKYHFEDEYPTLIKEKDLPLYLNLNKAEVADLLKQYPDAPKIELDGTTYYPYRPFMKWVTSKEIYQ
ncbi:DNA-binding protein [Terribacillus saccharophilus]|uniref:DNA-binding protein n=1 Tax=Terribacillus saccharophilus TaxID=361277 RepID=UPI003982AA95